MISNYDPMKPKKQVKIYLDKDVYERLWRLIKAKYSSTYGALSVEVQNAIVAWLNAHNAQEHTNKVNPDVPRIFKICHAIILHLRRQGYINQVSLRDLASAIAETRGSDARTVKKWIKTLLEFGFIKRVSTYTYEIL